MTKNKLIFYLRMAWIVFGFVFLVWIVMMVQPRGVDDSLLVSSESVRVVDNDQFIEFTPTDTFSNVVIFFPGAMVSPRAYAPLCRAVSERGVCVKLIKMPMRMASLGYKLPIELNVFADTTKRYTLIGHSQGGKMAAQFVYEYPEYIDQLILLGTTHPRDISLANSRIRTMKIEGTNDGVASLSKSFQNRNKLHANTQFIEIEGANHSQFGYYGFQLGDNNAAISRKEQHRIVVENVVRFINE